MLFRHFLTLVCSPTANKELNVYSYAMPTYNSTSAVAPLQIVSSMYGFPITDPTIIGVIASSKIAIFSCRNANCQDYNEAIYLELKNQTFGRSIATTLTANSNLVILYTKTKPGGGYELWLDICRDPLCAIPGVSQVVDSSLTTDVDMWLGYNINQNVPLIVVSDPHTQTLKSYDCNAQGKCKAPVTIISGATNSFSISPYQVTEKKKLVTKNFLMTIATAQPATGTSTSRLINVPPISLLALPLSLIPSLASLVSLPLLPTLSLDLEFNKSDTPLSTPLRSIPLSTAPLTAKLVLPVVLKTLLLALSLWSSLPMRLPPLPPKSCARPKPVALPLDLLPTLSTPTLPLLPRLPCTVSTKRRPSKLKRRSTPLPSTTSPRLKLPSLSSSWLVSPLDLPSFSLLGASGSAVLLPPATLKSTKLEHFKLSVLRIESSWSFQLLSALSLGFRLFGTS